MVKPRKSIFIHGPVSDLPEELQMYNRNLRKVIEKLSKSEIIGNIAPNFSIDGKSRPLIISEEIIDKIQLDHGNICSENMIINAHHWEFMTTGVLGNPDKINLIKQIPDSENYLLIAAVRVNGFYIVTHFETKTSGTANLKRLLNRGNVLRRGHSIGLNTTNQGNSPTRECI